MEVSREEYKQMKQNAGKPHSPNRTPHVHAELIKAWADGAEIQFRNSPFNQWVDCADAPAWCTAAEYRIKPETVRFRNYLWTAQSLMNPGRTVVSVCSEKEHKDEPRDTWSGFIRWLGDWQEVEV